MGAARRAAMIAACLVACMSASGFARQQFDPDRDIVKIRVPYDGLDLHTAGGRDRFIVRVRRTARRVCVLRGLSLIDHVDRRCTRELADDAAAQIAARFPEAARHVASAF